jgi:hypothetical protein
LILYDQNYNFIGISNETLSYLGYEDLTDFTSQHSDFANLLVNKEGYIYKFQNFSWIDFILYSGSPNKLALLKLKSGEELEIKLSVKEVHLTVPIGNSEKYYAVRILSDNFVNIASKTDASIVEKSPPKNSFNLNSLMTTEQHVEGSTSTPPPVLEDTQNDTESDFVLNFPSSDELKESPIESIDLREKEDSEPLLVIDKEDFSLNLSDTISDTTEEEIAQSTDSVIKEHSSQDFALKLPTEEDDTTVSPLSEEKSEISLNFLKTTHEDRVAEKIKDAQVNTEVSLDFLKSDETASVSDTVDAGFKLKHRDTVEESPLEADYVAKNESSENISLNFLKTEDTTSSNIEDEDNETLSFIKIEEDSPLEQENQASQIEEDVFSTLKKEQIIAQIKSDIDEIDAVEESELFEKNENTHIEEEDFALNATLFNKNEVKKEKKSFTNTLKSLFIESNELENKVSKEEEFLNIAPEPEATLKEHSGEESTHISLSALGLDKAEEDALLQEFIHDTKENIALFKSFVESNNLEQTDYLLIKMHSSADILNLNDIIETLTQIRESCKESDTNNIEMLLGQLQMQVHSLESYLAREAV